MNCTDCAKTIRTVSSPEGDDYCTCLDGLTTSALTTFAFHYVDGITDALKYTDLDQAVAYALSQNEEAEAGSWFVARITAGDSDDVLWSLWDHLQSLPETDRADVILKMGYLSSKNDH